MSMDHQKFGKRVQELLRRKGLHQNELADKLNITPSFLSQVLAGGKPLTRDRAKACILYLAEEGAIRESGYVDELLELAGCEDFSPTDWASWPLVDLRPSQVGVVERSIPQQQAVSSDFFDGEAARHKYLEGVLHWYRSLILPVGSQNGFALQSVFQPLPLHRELFFAEDLPYEDRRALLDESTRSEDDPRWAGSEKRDLSYDAEGQRRSTVESATDGFDALSKSPQQCMVVLGPPGIGKTTLLKYLIVETARKALANPTEMIPLFVSLPDFVNAGLSFQEYLSTLTGMLGVDNRYAVELWQAIEKGKAFVCLDMLEQVSPERRRDLITWINVHLAEPGNACIVSSRFSEYNGGQFLPHFLEWELRPMTHRFREQLASALLPIFSEATRNVPTSLLFDPSGFVRTLEADAHAVNWGNNPLLFSLTANTFVRTGKLPSSRAALYKETIGTLLTTRQKNRNRQAALRMIIASLALQLYQERRRLLTREELVARLARIHIPQQEIGAADIAQSIIDSGILEVVAKDLYGFWHQTFLEYFAAVDLARRLIDQQTKQDAWELAWKKHTSSYWTEVLRLMVGILLYEYGAQGGVEIARSWLQALVEQGTQRQGDIGDLGLALAIRSLSDVGALAPLWSNTQWKQLEELMTSAWVEALLDATEHDHAVRKRHLLQLAPDICQLKPSMLASLVELLETKLSSWDARVRMTVIDTFGRLGAYAPMKQLVKALGDLHRNVRAAAVQALIHLEAHLPADALRMALQDKSAIVREEAIRVLGAVKQPVLVEELEGRLHDEVWSVRLVTVEALGNLREQLPCEKLFVSLHDEDAFVRHAAVEAVGKRENDAALDLLLAALDDPDDWVRGAAIEALGERTPIEKLIAEAFSSPEVAFPHIQFAQHAAEAALAKRGEQGVLKEIISAGIPESPEVRKRVQSIVESQQETPRGELLEALYSNDAERRGQAIEILSRKKDREPLERFITSPETRESVTRATALRLVGKLGEQDLVRQALQGLDASDARVRLAAVEALRDLGKLVPVEAVAVVDLIEDEDRLIRATALQVLSLAIGHVIVTLPLIESLLRLASEESDKRTQDAAKQCLEKGGRSIPKQLFGALIHHEEPEIRLIALQHLWQYIPMRQIQEAFSDNDEDVRETAALAANRRKARSAWRKLFKAATSRKQQRLISIDVEHSVEAQLLKELCGESILQQIVTTREVRVEDFDTWNPRWWPGSGLGRMPLMAVRTDEAEDSFTKAQIDLENEIHEQIIQLLKKHAPTDRLLAILGHEEPDMRLAALQALGARVSEEQLLAALDDEDPLVQREALRSLDVRTPQRQLLQALRSQHEMVREVALEILRKSVQRLPEAELLEALESANAITRLSAIQALGKHASAEKLLAALGDSSEDVRLVALDMLLHVHPETRPRIVSEVTSVLLHKKTSMLIESAAQSFLLEIIRQMTEQMTPTIYDKLIELLDWSYWEVQMKAVQVLGTIPQNISTEVVERLFDLRRDAVSQTVRIAANDSLVELLSLERGFEDSRSEHKNVLKGID